MNTQRFEELLVGWEEYSLSAKEIEEFKHLLATEPQARRRLVEAGVLRGAAETQIEAWRQDKPASHIPSSGVFRRASLFGSFGWRPFTAAAAGMILGMFCTSMVWAYMIPSAVRTIALLRESFESGVTQTTPGLPRETGSWTGDEAQVVASENSVQPRSGARMLRFVSATFPGENAKHSAWSDVYRLVDLRGQVSNAKSVLRLSASFDATQIPAGETWSSSVELCALETDLAELPQPLTLPWIRENSAATALRKVPLRGDGQWQDTSVEILVSPGTRFVLVHLAVLRTKPYPPAEPVQFSGHYVDAVKLELLTKPAP